MAVYTVTLSDLQDAALTAHVAEVNAQRQAAGKPVYANNQAYIDVSVAGVLDPVLARFVETRVHVIADTLRKAGLAKIAETEEVLGLREKQDVR